MYRTDSHADDSEPDAADRLVEQAFRSPSDDALEAQLRGQLRGFRQDLREHAYVRRLERPLWQMLWGWSPRLAAAASLGAVLVVGAVLFSLSQSVPTWAQVAEKFNSVNSLTATIYVKVPAWKEPRQCEVWIDRSGKGRVRCDSQVVFSQGGNVVKAFDVERREETSPNQFASDVVRTVGSERTYSIETVLKIFGDTLSEATPQVNADAMISEDLVVFDIQSASSAERCRVWALRRSKLPVRVLAVDPASGRVTDSILTYSKPQPAGFFDPDVFAQQLKQDPGTGNRLAYTDLEEWIGMAIPMETPADPKTGTVPERK
jgi:outer membrane lipoprotein-sorting protein